MSTEHVKPGGADPERTRLIAGVHAAAKEKGMAEDDRRALMQRLVSKTSTKDMTKPDLRRVLSAIKGRAAVFPWQLKIRALWISLGQLGVLRDRSDTALDAFVAKQSHVTALRFLPADQSEPVIQALKAWLARPTDEGGGGVQWAGAGASDQQCVAYALWRKLMEKGAVRNAIAACAPYCRTLLGVKEHRPLTPAEWGEVLPTLAAKLRKADNRHENHG